GQLSATPPRGRVARVASIGQLEATNCPELPRVAPLVGLWGPARNCWRRGRVVVCAALTTPPQPVAGRTLAEPHYQAGELLQPLPPRCGPGAPPHDLLPERHQGEGGQASRDLVIRLADIAHTWLEPDVHLQSRHDTPPQAASSPPPLRMSHGRF